MIGSSRVPDLWTSLTISIPRTEVGSDPVRSGPNASLVLRVMACASAHPPSSSFPAAYVTAALAFLRRANARRPPHAAIRPGRPAPTIGPGTATVSPNRICATLSKPTVVVNATLERSSPPAVVSVKKFCPEPLRGSKKLNEAPNWSMAVMFALPLATASRLKTAVSKKKPGIVVTRLFKMPFGTDSIRACPCEGVVRT
jgi:hypothetical protein